MTILDKIYSFICENNMLSSGDTVICGLSGGADSVALLLSLFQIREKLKINVEAIHVNHCIREDESDRDEEFCRRLCAENGIPFKAVRCNVPEEAERIQKSLEETARIMRYEQFSKNSAGKKLATAHNANDNLETLILNLARGTGVKGLAGIPCIRGNIIRPLLTVTRDEIEVFLRDMDQPYVTDTTNLSDDYTRNKIRHRIIPLLKEINSSVIETSVNSIATLREENSTLEGITDRAMEQCRNGQKLSGLTSYDSVTRKRCISRLLSEKQLPYSYKRLEEADYILLHGGKINISGKCFLIGSNDSLELKLLDKEEMSIDQPLIIGDNTVGDICTVKCEIIECDNLKKIEAVHKKSTFYVLDYDKIKGKLFLRTRKYGDKIKLKGRSFTSSIKKLINERIPAEKRNGLLFAADDEGTILAEGIGVADRVAPDDNTARFLTISFIRS